MSNRFRIGNQGGGIGDSLQITPVFKYFTDGIIEVKDNEQGYKVGRLYEKMAKVIYLDNPITQEESFIKYGDINKSHPLRNGALNYLTIYGIENKVSPIPWVVLADMEVEWAENYLKKYHNPVIVVTSTAASDRDSNGNHSRCMSRESWQDIINFYSSTGHQVIHIGSPNNKHSFDNVFREFDLNVRQAAACFKVVKKVITVDTGLYHLALAAGAYTKCLVPTFGWGDNYYFPNWSYTPNMFDNECLVEYYTFDDYRAIFKRPAFTD